MGVYHSPVYTADLRETVRNSAGIDQLAGSTLFIAGSAGLLGSFLVDTLAIANYDKDLNLTIVATDRNLDRLKARFGSIPWQGVRLNSLDVTSEIDIDLTADYVIHLASNADPKRIVSDPVGTIRSNVDGTLSLLQWGSCHGCKRFLYVSSGEVYGVGQEGLQAYKESYQGLINPLSLRSCYPLSKRMAENACVAWSNQHGVQSVIVRPSHSYGPVARQTDSRANAQFVASALAGQDVIMKSAGAQIRSYTYVSDTVSGMLSVLCKGTSERAYNLANPNSVTSIAGFAREVCNQAGVSLIQGEYNENELKNQTPIQRQVLDSSALEELGWSGRYDLARGIRHTLEAMREMEA